MSLEPRDFCVRRRGALPTSITCFPLKTCGPPSPPCLLQAAEDPATCGLCLLGAVLAVVDMMWPRSGAQDKWNHVPHVQPPRAFVLMTKRRNEEALRAFPGVGAVCGWVQPGQTCSGGAKGPLSLQAGAVQEKEGTGCSTGQDSLVS